MGALVPSVTVDCKGATRPGRRQAKRNRRCGNCADERVKVWPLPTVWSKRSIMTVYQQRGACRSALMSLAILAVAASAAALALGTLAPSILT